MLAQAVEGTKLAKKQAGAKAQNRTLGSTFLEEGGGRGRSSGRKRAGPARSSLATAIHLSCTARVDVRETVFSKFQILDL